VGKDLKEKFLRKLPVDQGLVGVGKNLRQLPATGSVGSPVCRRRHRKLVVIVVRAALVRAAQLPGTAVHVCQMRGVSDHNSTRCLTKVLPGP